MLKTIISIEALFVMSLDPFYLVKSVLNAPPEIWCAAGEGFCRGAVVFIYTISHSVNNVYFHIIVKTGGDMEVHLRLKDPYEVK